MPTDKMQPDQAHSNREPEYQELIAGHSQHIGAPVPAADSITNPATDSVIDPAPDNKVDPYQDPAYNQPHVVVESPKDERSSAPEMQACIDSCLECHKQCLSEATNGHLEADRLQAKSHHFRMLLNCAEICQTSANFLLSKSPFYGHLCNVCAQICEACAQGCYETLGMAACAAQCRQCAESCCGMARMAANGIPYGSCGTDENTLETRAHSAT